MDPIKIFETINVFTAVVGFIVRAAKSVGRLFERRTAYIIPGGFHEIKRRGKAWWDWYRSRYH